MKKMLFILLSIVLSLSSCNKSTGSISASSSSAVSENIKPNFEGYPVNTSELIENQNFTVAEPSLFEVEQLKDKTLRITKYLGKDSKIILPSSLHNLPVTSIGSGSFTKKDITGIVMPNSITEIEDSILGDPDYGAFAYNDIVFLALSNNLAYIGANAFYNNKKLNTVTIPDSTIIIQYHAFASCDINSVFLGSKLEYIGEGAFEYNKFKTVALPSSLKYIASEAFRETLLNKIVIPDGVSFIGDAAFPETVTEAVIPPSLVKYDINKSYDAILGFRGAFKNPKNIIRISLPDNVDLKNFSSNIFGSGFENGFINFYTSQNKKAGIYAKTGQIWGLE